MVKVLIVDDSAFMRSALANMLSSDPEIQIVGSARDGLEAIEKVVQLKPDIVTMDVEMPRMDGIAALRHIMAHTPVPVIMVSSLTAEGAQITLEALEIGAVDFIPKNLSEMSLNILRLKEVLVDKIKQLARKGVVRRAFRPPVRPASNARGAVAPAMQPVMRTTGDRRVGLVAIGTSTGGPKALQEILPALPKEFPVPIVIAQHMPASFTGPFAERLNQLSKIEVREAKEGDVLRPGLALIAPGGGHMRIARKRSLETVVAISEDRENFIYRPSVDALMTSVAECFPGRALGVILTGMGNDGLKGLIDLKKTGGRIFAQNEESCVVYGMPKAVVDAGIADKVLSIEEVAGEIVNSV
jgi:two-component system chemotaxis response regulator CheB